MNESSRTVSVLGVLSKLTSVSDRSYLLNMINERRREGGREEGGYSLLLSFPPRATPPELAGKVRVLVPFPFGHLHNWLPALGREISGKRSAARRGGSRKGKRVSGEGRGVIP